MGQCKTIKKSSYTNSVTTISRAYSDINDVRVTIKYPSKKSQKMIEASLSKHNLFSKMTNEDFLILLHDIIFYQFPSDRSVFDQGEKGSLFYLVESGKLAVIRSGVKKTILQQGDYFGDMALLTDFPRRATIKTIEPSELWAINRESFLKVVKSINHRSASENKEFISKLKIFFNLPNGQMKKLAANLVQQEFPDSTRIICEGDEGILLHIIKHGQAVVKMHGSEMFRLIEGEMFGESAVLGLNRIYQFSVYSVGKLEVLSLSIENIQKILGDDFKDILYKNQAKSSILSNKYFKLMSRENVDRIIENLEWKLVQPGSEPLCNPLEHSLVYIVAYGTLSCGEMFFKQHEVIGFLDKKKRLERLRGEIKAESEVIVGSILISKIEEIGKMHFKEIKNRLKIVNILKKLEFFAEISQKKLRFIADTTRKVKFENKELIYKFNDEAKTFFIFKSGGVQIYQYGKMLRVLGKYDIFGDNCLHEKTRSTNAKAVSQCKCLVIQGEDFKEIMNSNSDFFLRRTRSSLSLFRLNELIFLKFIRMDEQRHCFVTHLHNNEFFFYVEVLNKNLLSLITALRSYSMKKTSRSQ